MALFIKQDEQRSELQQRIATELQQKAKQKPATGDLPDGVDDSQYIKGMKMTTNRAWIWAVVILVVLVGIIWLTVISMSR